METIVDSAKLTSFYVLAYSMGVPVALGYVIRHPDRLRGAILLDYPARYPLIPVDWLERAKEYAPANVKAHVIEAIQRESSEVLLWNDLKVLECPVLVIQAGKKGALLTDDMVELYKKHLADCMAVKFDESDHQLWKPDPQKFFRTITAFLDANEAEDR
jgi:pimeloyl-ACP methyl ester carboxylesterase